MSATISQLRAEVIVDGADQAKREIASVSSAIEEQASRSSRATDATARHDQALSKLGTGAMVAGGALLAGFGLAVGAAADFEQAMSGVGAVSDANAHQLSALRQAALDAGAATAFSASDAATAETELARAGVSTADILGGALKGSLDLAAAGQISIADSATIAAQALNIFNLSGNQTSHVADLLAAGANKSAADVGQLGQALQQGGLLAKQTGLSIEDTVGALSLFADNALQGSDAGTSLKTMLQRLTPQSAEAKAEMERLGISAYDAQGQFVGLDKFAGNLRQSMKNLTPEARNSAMAVIFGSDAVRAANILYDAGAKGVDKYVRAVNDQGAASRMAGTQLDNLKGDLEQLRGSLETTLITGGSGATDVLRGMTQEATTAVNVFGSLPEPVQGAAVGLTGVAGAGLLVTGAIGSLVPKVRDGLNTLRQFRDTAASTPGAMGKLGGSIDLVTAALVPGIAVWVQYQKAVADGQRRANVDKDAMLGGLNLHHLEDLDKGIERVREGLCRAKRELEPSNDTGGKVAEVWQSLNPFVDNDIEDLRQKVHTYSASMKELSAAWHTVQGNVGKVRVKLGDMFGEDTIPKSLATTTAIERVADSLGVDLSQKGLAGRQAVAAVADAMGSQTSAAYGSEASLQAMGTAADGADSALQSFKSTMDGLLGVHLDAADGAIKFEDSIDQLSQSVKDNGLTFDITSEKGRANAEAMIGASRAALDHAEAVGKETGSVGMANLALAGHINQLADTAHQIGLTDDQTLTYLEDLYGIPPETRTDIHTTADLASLLVKGLHTDIDQLPKNTDVNINVFRREHYITDSTGAVLSGGGGKGHASGGKIAMGGEWLLIGETIAEQGNEFVHLPGGSQVFSTPTTDAMRRGANASGGTVVHVTNNVTVKAPLGTSPARYGAAIANHLDQLVDAGGGNLVRRWADEG